MKILVTGAAGFIGAACCERLLTKGHEVLGIDNFNSYYSPRLKQARINRLPKKHFQISQLDITNKEYLTDMVVSFKPDIILHLAAQAGVRYSIDNPTVYVQSNLIGFVNLLELSRQLSISHFVYASSSSVYGANQQLPYRETDKVDNPLSLYAATKKSNEMLAHSYAHLFAIPCTGLRFFTVYGPWGRPDMAPMKFAKRIILDEPIQVYNYGEHSRDFTYIDDIVTGVTTVVEMPPSVGNHIYNLGRGDPLPILTFIKELEQAIGKKAKLEFLPKQPGDVDHTWADVSKLKRKFAYEPKTNLVSGIKHFSDWFLYEYLKLENST